AVGSSWQKLQRRVWMRLAVRWEAQALAGESFVIICLFIPPGFALVRRESVPWPLKLCFFAHYDDVLIRTLNRFPPLCLPAASHFLMLLPTVVRPPTQPFVTPSTRGNFFFFLPSFSFLCSPPAALAI